MKPIYHFWAKHVDGQIYVSDIEQTDDNGDFQKAYQDLPDWAFVTVAKDKDQSLMEYCFISPSASTMAIVKLALSAGVALCKYPSLVVTLMKQEIGRAAYANKASDSDEDGHESENA